MGEVGETIPDIPVSNDHGIASLTNGDVQNGIEKITGQPPIDKMDVDEDESQLSSSENGNSIKFSLLDPERLKQQDNPDDSHSSVDISVTKNNNNNDNDRNDENSNHMASIDSQEDQSQNSDLKSHENGSTVDENSTQNNDDEETTQDTLKSSSVPDDDISQIKTDQINEGDTTTQESNTIKEDEKSEDKSESGEASVNIAEESTKMEVDGDNNTVPKSKDTNPLDSLVHDETKKIDESSTSSTNNFSNRNGSTETDVGKNKIDNNSITIIESDEDDEDPFKDIPEKVAQLSTANSNGKVTKNNEEDAVLIDDSDAEEKDDNTTTISLTTIATTTNTTPTNSTATSIAAAVINKSSPLQLVEARKIEDDDDDDDDCVVIDDDDDEDDDPLGNQDQSDANESSTSLSGHISSVRARKNIMSRDELDLTDDEPPYKRQKTSGINPLNSLQSGTITITPRPPEMSDEPRSFQQSFMQQSGANNNNNNRAVLTPLPNNQVPKLAPVSNVLNSNANLLPALTDDMFVLEAPSFIVPYIYEKPPETTLRAVVEKLQSDFNFDDIKEDEDDLLKDLSALKAKPSSSAVAESSGEAKSKRKRRRKDGDDDEWNEFDESISSDEEGSSVNSDGVPKVIISKAETDDINIIKAAISAPDKIVSKDPLGGADSTQSSEKKPENYFESPLGKFFIDIGINLVQEYVQADLLKIQKRKQRKSTAEEDIKTYELAINALQKNLDASKKRNEPFKFSMKRCEFCTFKTESALGMANHYETPHVDKNIYKCNFCSFEVRQTTHEILFHMEAVHNIKGRLERPLLLNQCPNCPFEDNGKSKFGRHQPVCAKKFRPEINLCAPPDWEAPAKIPRIKPRHGLVGTATAYQAMAAQAAAQKAALVSLQAQQQATRNLITAKAAMTQRNRNNLPTNNVISNRNQVRNSGSMSGRNQMQNVKNLPNNYQIQGGHLVQVPGTSMAILPNSFNFQSTQNQKRMGQQPSISITPLPRQPNNSLSPSSSGFAAGTPPQGAKPGIKPGQSPSKTSFVICEICDGYIKDLEQLRNHMQWMHKVKIHPKMIYNRPPLNCQKCQFRFFTDQGLERHLLGSHGLVTSSMQEAANKGKDAGRCPVCGRMYQWKLLNHVSRDHNMTLKPAHLSYKCTVCTATFGMYKQFENHVYTAHSTVAKKAMDVKNKTIPIGGSGNNGSNSPNIQKGAGNSNDPLLKPLRINDEITIIPQPAKKN